MSSIAWIATAADGDLRRPLRRHPPVDAAGTVATAVTGDLGSIRRSRSKASASRRASSCASRCWVEATDADFNLYVRAARHGAERVRLLGVGSASTLLPHREPQRRIVVPARRGARGKGVFQLVATTVGGRRASAATASAGGEKCDGPTRNRHRLRCELRLRRVLVTDLDVPEIVVTPRLFLQATIGDGTGTYTTVDPASAGVTIELIDDTHGVPIVIRRATLGLVNPRRAYGGAATRRAVKKLEFRSARRRRPNGRFACRAGTSRCERARLPDAHRRVRIGTRARASFPQRNAAAFPRRARGLAGVTRADAALCGRPWRLHPREWSRHGRADA
jgi:hypothetical protein